MYPNVIACGVILVISSMNRGQAQQIVAGLGITSSTIEEGWSATIHDGRMLIGPDPNDAIDALKLLKDWQIQSELELSPTQITKIGSVETSLTLSIEYRDVTHMSPEIACEFVDASLKEILGDARRKRLRELTYRLQIEIMGGYYEAITDGRLGQLIEVYENQKSTLYQQINKHTKKLNEEIRKIQLLDHPELAYVGIKK